ncbi:MAG: hypothetical protein JNK72_01755 [Myxococcales bacterium]|nr:hypothetical protein [Myxococcales bacterium]
MTHAANRQVPRPTSPYRAASHAAPAQPACHPSAVGDALVVFALGAVLAGLSQFPVLVAGLASFLSGIPSTLTP